MKQVQLFLLVALMSISSSVFAAVGDPGFGGGTGTSDDPWQIKTATHLNNMRENLTTERDVLKYFKLMNDIDLADISATNNWTILTKDGAWMEFDGNNFVIKNLHMENVPDNYQSLFGVHWGLIKNLGLVNVYINCPAGGSVGAFAGSLGSTTPGTRAFRVGMIENCFATGYISGGAGSVGGLVGAMGRASDRETATYIKNSYFSGELYNTYGNTSLTVRTGGIAGMINANTVEANNIAIAIENCYATGYFHAKKGRIGGIVGETELTIRNSVSYADLEDEGNTEPNSIGLIAGWCNNSGTVQWGKVENCWVYSGATMKRNGEVVVPSYFTTPAIEAAEAPVDGELKDAAYLSSAINYYSVLDFSMAGETAIWSQQLRNGAYPQLVWVASRPDAESIDGLSNGLGSTGFATPMSKSTPNVFALGNVLVFENINERYQVAVYDSKGSLLKSFEQQESGASIVMPNSNILFVKMTNASGASYSQKVLVK